MSPEPKTEQEVTVGVASDGDVATVVMEARRQSREIGFDASTTSRVATAASELARNIVAYAGDGRLTLRIVREGARCGIEICADDHGPGIDDLDLALSDHYSTGKTLGLGLPGVRRLMDQFEIDSAPGEGTRVKVCKWK